MVLSGASAAHAGSDWREDWQKVLRAGKQEGRLVIYTFPGLSTAIGLSLAFPERPVVCITGDGSFMLESQELATAAALKLPVSVIVIRNNAYGNMKRDQIRHYGGRVIGTDLHLPDLCTLATAYGIASERVIDPSALQSRNRWRRECRSYSMRFARLRGFDRQNPGNPF